MLSRLSAIATHPTTAPTSPSRAGRGWTPKDDDNAEEVRVTLERLHSISATLLRCSAVRVGVPLRDGPPAALPAGHLPRRHLTENLGGATAMIAHALAARPGRQIRSATKRSPRSAE